MYTSTVIAFALIFVLSPVGTIASGPSEDVCGLNYFLNEDGECIPNNECVDISVIVTDECQPRDRMDWPDPECPYGLALGGDDGCYHVKGYPIPEDHKKDHVDGDWEIVSPETCKENPDHPFC